MAVSLVSAPAMAGAEQSELIDRSALAVRSLLEDPDNAGFRDLVSQSHAVMVFPQLIKAGFIFGGTGGTGVLLRREDFGWSNPAFIGLGGASVGLQIGGQSSEIIFAIMTERGLEAILNRKVKLGGDAGLAIGTIGKGVQAASAADLEADVYAVSSSIGLFGGASIEGVIIEDRSSWNEALYGRPLRPRAIMELAPVDRADVSGLWNELPSVASSSPVAPTGSVSRESLSDSN